MTSSTASSQTAVATNSVAADSHSLDQLKMLANKEPAKAVKQVATQFEAMFMQMVLKTMREASLKSGLLDSAEQQTYIGMLDEQMAQKIAAGGTGLGDVIARQLSRNLPQTTDAAATAAASPPVVGPTPPGAAEAIAVASTGRPTGALVQSIRAAQFLRNAK